MNFPCLPFHLHLLDLIFVVFSMFHNFPSREQFFDLYSNRASAALLFWHRNAFGKNTQQDRKTWTLRVLAHRKAHQTISNYQELLRNVFWKKSFSRQIRNLFGEFRSKLSFSFDYLDAKNSQQISEEFVDLKNFSSKHFFVSDENHSSRCHLPAKKFEIEEEILWLLLASWKDTGTKGLSFRSNISFSKVNKSCWKFFKDTHLKSLKSP